MASVPIDGIMESYPAPAKGFATLRASVNSEDVGTQPVHKNMFWRGEVDLLVFMKSSRAVPNLQILFDAPSSAAVP